MKTQRYRFRLIGFFLLAAFLLVFILSVRSVSLVPDAESVPDAGDTSVGEEYDEQESWDDYGL